MTGDLLPRALLAIAAWKAVEVFVLAGPTQALPFVLAVLGLVSHARLGAVLLAAVCLSVIAGASWYGQPATNHLAWVMWVSVTVGALPDPAQQRNMLRVQLSILYGFSVLAKIWPDWLTGEALATRTAMGAVAPQAVLVAVAWATLLVEAVLAVAAWLRWRGWILLAAALHVAFLLGTTTDFWRVGRLVIFGGLTMAVWVRAYEPTESEDTALVSRP